MAADGTSCTSSSGADLRSALFLCALPTKVTVSEFDVDPYAKTNADDADVSESGFDKEQLRNTEWQRRRDHRVMSSGRGPPPNVCLIALAGMLQMCSAVGGATANCRRGGGCRGHFF